MKVTVDLLRCQGNGMCMKAAPEVFEVRPDGSLRVLQDEPAATLHKAVTQAARRCPTRAITVRT